MSTDIKRGAWTPTPVGSNPRAPYLPSGVPSMPAQPSTDRGDQGPNGGNR
jgi:hypothetical protein